MGETKDVVRAYKAKAVSQKWILTFPRSNSMSSVDTHDDSELELKTARSEQYYWGVVILQISSFLNACRSQE